jgi:hypothetical protein
MMFGRVLLNLGGGLGYNEQKQDGDWGKDS